MGKQHQWMPKLVSDEKQDICMASKYHPLPEVSVTKGTVVITVEKLGRHHLNQVTKVSITSCKTS